MMTSRHIFFLLNFLISLSFAHAQETSAPLNRTSESSSKIIENRKFQETDTLTDSKLRAEDGSLSHYSFKFKLVYRGPTLSDPTEADQPNPDGSVGNYSQALKGTLTSRFRLSSTQALSLGVGVVLNHPFHGMDRTDAKDPFLSHDTALRFGEVQMRSSPGISVITTPELKAVGQTSALTYDNALFMNFEKTRWGVGLESNASWWFYNRPYRFGKKASGGDGSAQQYALFTAPTLKYTITQKLAAYSGIYFEWDNPRQLNSRSVLLNRLAYLRTGLSYSYQRDAYVAAYLDSYPSLMSVNSTTLNFQTIFSVF